MPNLLSSWKKLKAQGYTRADRLYLLKVAGRQVSGSASTYCGWPAVPRVRSDRRRGRRSYTEYGERISAALASSSWGDLVGVLDDLSERVSRDTSDKVLSRLPTSAREAVGVCSCCGAYHERAGGVNDNEHGLICSVCLPSFFVCAGCECRYRVEDGRRSPSDDCYCDSCFSGAGFCLCVACSDPFAASDCYDAAGGYICSECSEGWYLWESDGLYHDRDADPLKIKYPNQGPDESGTLAHKWLVERSALGVVRGVLRNDCISNDGLSHVFATTLKVTGLTYGLADNVGGRCGPDALYASLCAERIEGRGLPWQTKAGTIPKRIAKWFRANLSRKLTPAQSGAIGDAARAYCPPDTDYFLEIKRPPFDWNRGDFGDPLSCYWSCHTYARKQLESQHNAFALRFWNGDGENRRGVGRCWCVVRDGAALLFNAYGPFMLLTCAQILAEVSGGWKVTKISPMVNNGSGGGWLFLNNSLGYAVHPEGVSVPDRFDFRWKNQRGE